MLSTDKNKGWVCVRGKMVVEQRKQKLEEKLHGEILWLFCVFVNVN